MCVFAFKIPDTNKVHGIYATIDAIKERVLLCEICGVKCLMVEHVIYTVSNDLFLKYGIMCDSEKDAFEKGIEWEASAVETQEDFQEIFKQLSDV